MALHSELPLYAAIYDLFGAATKAVIQMPRPVKGAIGQRIIDSCVELDIHLRQANIDQDKEPRLQKLLEELERIELLTRVCRDNAWLPTKRYADLVERTQSIGRQTNGWRTWLRTQAGPQQGQLFIPQGG